jgi:hypothetical protein
LGGGAPGGCFIIPPTPGILTPKGTFIGALTAGCGGKVPPAPGEGPGTGGGAAFVGAGEGILGAGPLGVGRVKPELGERTTPGAVAPGDTGLVPAGPGSGAPGVGRGGAAPRGVEGALFKPTGEFMPAGVGPGAGVAILGGIAIPGVCTAPTGIGRPFGRSGCFPTPPGGGVAKIDGFEGGDDAVNVMGAFAPATGAGVGLDGG